jgi:hypothetical protein
MCESVCVCMNIWIQRKDSWAHCDAGFFLLVDSLVWQRWLQNKKIRTTTSCEIRNYLGTQNSKEQQREPCNRGRRHWRGGESACRRKRQSCEAPLPLPSLSLSLSLSRLARCGNLSLSGMWVRFWWLEKNFLVFWICPCPRLVTWSLPIYSLEQWHPSDLPTFWNTHIWLPILLIC